MFGKTKKKKEEAPEVVVGERHDPHCGLTEKHMDEVVKFIQFGQRKVHLTIKEEGDIGEEYLRVEMRRTNSMLDAEDMNKRVIHALTSLVNDGQISAMVINQNGHKVEE
jgi:hypothetical protein